MNVTDVHITRTVLGLPPLNINDRVSYRLVAIAPSTMKWRRQRATSAYVDGAVTTSRSRDSRDIQITIDVQGPDRASIDAARARLITAFSQDTFNVGWTIDDEPTLITGEAADYETDYDRSRVAARRMSMVFTFPSDPIPLEGSL